MNPIATAGGKTMERSKSAAMVMLLVVLLIAAAAPAAHAAQMFVEFTVPDCQ